MSKNNKKQHRTDGIFNSNNETIPIEYFEERAHCRKRCVTGSCSLCDKFINLAKTIKNTNHKICFEEGNNEK